MHLPISTRIHGGYEAVHNARVLQVPLELPPILTATICSYVGGYPVPTHQLSVEEHTGFMAI